MANIKIQQLTEKTTANDNDVLIIEDAVTTSKIKFSNLLKDTVIESGSNTNGSWVKFPDGTMVCFLDTVVENFDVKNKYGSVYQNSWKWDYPAPFVGVPVVNVGQFRWYTGVSWGTVAGATPSQATLVCIDALERQQNTAEISVIAIGSWK